MVPTLNRSSGSFPAVPVLVVIQARTGSTRLPEKVLMPIAGESMLLHVVERARRIPGIDRVVVATSDLRRDDAIEDLCTEREVDCVRGSESDVLGRYLLAARRFQAQTIVRVTADCPLLGWEEAGRTLAVHLARAADYTHNLTCYGSGMPLGTGVEVIAREALEINAREGLEAHHREHVCEYLYEHPERFGIQLVEAGPRFEAPQLRLTVDTRADLEFVRSLHMAKRCPGELLPLEWAIEHCARRGLCGAAEPRLAG